MIYYYAKAKVNDCMITDSFYDLTSAIEFATQSDKYGAQLKRIQYIDEEGWCRKAFGCYDRDGLLIGVIENRIL